MNSAENIRNAAPKPTAADTLPSDLSPAELNAEFRDLQELVEGCGDNKNDAVNVLISALIDLGINLSPDIIGAAESLDFNGTHARIHLNHGIGQRWTRDQDGTYRNLMQS